MDRLLNFIEAFFKQRNLFAAPLLLALSGGPDSLFLFYALLYLRDKRGLRFEVAHVDHGWRKESRKEASILRSLADLTGIPFHLKVLDASLIKGNLEAACRAERYAFFQALLEEKRFAAAITGHHLDDQAETVLKRILEGAHWSSWVAMKEDQLLGGLRILRPLLSFRKKEMEQWLQKKGITPFIDPTNQDPKFLRSRLRQTLLPHLADCFGKEVNQNLAHLSQEMEELDSYFYEALSPWIQQAVKGPFGIFLDVQEKRDLTKIEAKYLIRYFASQKKIFFSKQIVDQAALSLVQGKANLLFCMGKEQMWVDRKRLFFPFPKLNIAPFKRFISLREGHQVEDKPWKITLSPAIFRSDIACVSHWQMAWRGFFYAFLPIGSYDIAFAVNAYEAKIRKKWNALKIPLFLSSYFPAVLQEQKPVVEFLSGNSQLQVKEGERCLKLTIEWQPL